MKSKTTAAIVALFGCLVAACSTTPRRSTRAAVTPPPERVISAARAPAQVRPPRILTDDQRKRLVAVLRPAPVGKVEIVFQRGDEESANYASQLVTALLLVGELAELHAIDNVTHPTGASVGLRMQIPTGPAAPPHADAILDAFNKAHISREPNIAMGAPPGVLVITVESLEEPR